MVEKKIEEVLEWELGEKCATEEYGMCITEETEICKELMKLCSVMGVYAYYKEGLVNPRKSGWGEYASWGRQPHFTQEMMRKFQVQRWRGVNYGNVELGEKVNMKMIEIRASLDSLHQKLIDKLEKKGITEDERRRHANINAALLRTQGHLVLEV